MLVVLVVVMIKCSGDGSSGNGKDGNVQFSVLMLSTVYYHLYC